MEAPLVTAAVLLLAMAQQAPSPAPSPSPTAQATQTGFYTRTYAVCIRDQAEAWLKNPAPPSHVDSVMAACAPSLKPAARELVDATRAIPNEASILAAYKAKHGIDLDLTPAIEQRLHDQFRSAALQILSGTPGQVRVDLLVKFDSDGIKQ